MRSYEDTGSQPSVLDEDKYERVFIHGRERYVARGLCPLRSEHMPHHYHDFAVGPFWCHADQSQRNLDD